MAKKKLDKSKSQRVHAKRRFKERLGIEVTTAELDVLGSLIRRGLARLVKRQSNRASIWDIFMNDRMIRVVYDSRTKNVVTVLPEIAPLAQKEILNATPPTN